MNPFANSGNWKDKKFKEYNFDARGVLPASGHLHPLLKVRTEYRQIFLEMGSVHGMTPRKDSLISPLLLAVSLRCRRIISLRAPSGISTLFSSPSNIRREMRTTRSL